MTLSRLASMLTRSARVVRDVNAVKRHRVIERAENRAIGHVTFDAVTAAVAAYVYADALLEQRGIQAKSAVLR